MAVVLSDRVLDALAAAGIVNIEDRVRRVVIDLQVGHAAVIHIERYGDERLLQVTRALDGVEIRRE